MLLISGISQAQTSTRFNDGFLTVYKVTSSSALTSAGTAITTEEYLPTVVAQAAPNYSLALPSSNSSLGALDLVLAGTSTSSGAMTRSENGRYLVLPGYNALLGAANTTFTTNSAIRILNGGGTIGGLNATAAWFTGSNSFRGVASDDATNYWMTGSTTGVLTTTTGASTIVSATSTNTRFINIYNGQLYYSTGSGTNGIYKVGSGKPTVTGTTSVIDITVAAPTDYSISPDGLTAYLFNAASLLKYTYSGGVWTLTATSALAGGNGIAVDYSNYTFSTSAPNGAIIYGSNPSTVFTALDNGTSAVGFTVLRTEPTIPNNAFRSIAFSPIKQTVSKGANSPGAMSVTLNTTDVALFQFNLKADEGNSTAKKVIINQAGTAVIGTDITNFRLILDANGNGIYDGGEVVLSTGVVSGSDLVFSSINLPYINEGTSTDILLIADVTGSGAGLTFSPSIVANKTLNSVNYTTNVATAGGSWVNIGTSAPTGSTLTISAAVPVTFVSLNAYQKNAGIQLDWNVANEIGIRNYEVQRSANGMNFGKQATVSAGINTGNYTWFDNAPNNGVNFYRVSAVDMEGKISYTNIVKIVTGNNNSSIIISPNPVIGKTVTLQMNNILKGDYNVSVISLSGQVVYTSKMNLSSGSTTQTLQLPAVITPGVYQLKVVTPDQQINTQRLVIAN
ncbi:hypothetical protein BH09BAC2_BH09BAC2_05460 [soil metagenome]